MVSETPVQLADTPALRPGDVKYLHDDGGYEVVLRRGGYVGRVIRWTEPSPNYRARNGRESGRGTWTSWGWETWCRHLSHRSPGRHRMSRRDDAARILIAEYLRHECEAGS